jgi:hypothetical protein
MMESNNLMDWLVGGIALCVLLGGLWMLLGGVRGMGDQ